ncbi:MAG: SURF1 family protein [Shimia sp.]
MRLFTVFIGVIGTGVLLWLGAWQLDRLAWKEGVLTEIEGRIGAAPVPVPAAPDPEADRYRPVTATGMLGDRELHVLVSTKTRGAGYRVIRALETETGRAMVDLGYIPTRAKDAPRPAQALTVTGNLHWPDEIDRFTPEDDVDGNIWFARDVAKMAAALGTAPILIVARDLSPPVQGVTPLPVTSDGIPNNHLGYAVQWFGLAAVWVAMTGLFLWRGRRRREGEA